MATDNTILPEGTLDGDICAMDDIDGGGVANGAKVQRVKVGFGVDGSYADASASDPLPVTMSGAATAAKQPALGTAGTPSADVLTVQGHASGTALPVSVASVAGSSSLPAGTNNIGDVDVLTLPALLWREVPACPAMKRVLTEADVEALAGIY